MKIGRELSEIRKISTLVTNDYFRIVFTDTQYKNI